MGVVHAPPELVDFFDVPFAYESLPVPCHVKLLLPVDDFRTNQYVVAELKETGVEVKLKLCHNVLFVGIDISIDCVAVDATNVPDGEPAESV